MQYFRQKLLKKMNCLYVLLVDDVVYSEKVCLKQYIHYNDEYKVSVLGVQAVSEKDVSKYGIVDGISIENRVYKVKNLVEKPSEEEVPSVVSILVRYIITVDVFNIIENTKLEKGGEIQLTDGLKELIPRQDIYAYDFDRNLSAIV